MLSREVSRTGDRGVAHARLRSALKYQVRAKVDGTLYLAEPNSHIAAKRDGWEYRFESDGSGRVTFLSVVAPLPDEVAADASATIGDSRRPGVKAHLEFKLTPGVHASVIEEMQRIESLISFHAGHPVKRIRWHEPETTLVPETPEEEKRVQFWGVSHARVVPETPIEVEKDFLQQIVAVAPRFSEIVVPLAFWREGMNHMDRGEFVLAFNNHYFVLEDFYADGKSGQGPVLKAFARSAEFRTICAHALQEGRFKADDAESLRELFEREQCGWDPSGLQRLLFRMRGNAHHYSAKSGGPHPTPFTQGRFETIALLTMWLATTSIATKIDSIKARNQAEDDEGA